MANPNNKNIGNDKVLDTLITMYLEQQNMARHHEIQRSTVTTIFTSLATSVLAVIAVLWKINESFNSRFLPLAFALIILGIIGHLTTTKLFERAMSHFSLSEAYLNTIDALISQNVSDMLQDKVKTIEYVKKSINKIGWDFRPDGKGGRKVQEIKIVEKKNDVDKSESQDILAVEDDKSQNILFVEDHNPVNPREIVVPLHNENAKYNFLPYLGLKCSFAKLDLFRLWETIYLLMIVAGVVLSSVAYF